MIPAGACAGDRLRRQRRARELSPARCRSAPRHWRLLLVEFGRSACRWARRLVFVNGHGGNVGGAARCGGPAAVRGSRRRVVPLQRRWRRRPCRATPKLLYCYIFRRKPYGSTTWCRETVRHWPSCCRRCAAAGLPRSVSWGSWGTRRRRPRPRGGASLPRWSTVRPPDRALDARSRRDADVTQPRLPDGFAVQVDRRVQVLGEGSALLGGSPTRLLRLAPAAQTMLNGGRLEVHDAVSAQLARTLLDATVAHPRPASGPSHRDVTVVIPVRDNLLVSSAGRGAARPAGRRRRRRLGDARSCSPTSTACTATSRCCAIPAARDRRPRATPDWRRAPPTSSHSSTPTWCRAAVGWRRCSATSATPPSRWWRPASWTWRSRDSLVARYEAVRSSLDLGQREAPVVPYGTVSYVPSAAIICRRSALTSVGGFDETLQSGEDVDLCWRLIEAGARLALRAHRAGRPTIIAPRLREWFARKSFYGGVGRPAVDPAPRQDRAGGDLRAGRWWCGS